MVVPIGRNVVGLDVATPEIGIGGIPLGGEAGHCQAGGHEFPDRPGADVEVVRQEPAPRRANVVHFAAIEKTLESGKSHQHGDDEDQAKVQIVQWRMRGVYADSDGSRARAEADDAIVACRRAAAAVTVVGADVDVAVRSDRDVAETAEGSLEQPLLPRHPPSLGIHDQAQQVRAPQRRREEIAGERGKRAP